MEYYFKARTVRRGKEKIQINPRTEEEVVEDLARFYEQYGRAPTYQDFKKALAFGNSYPSSTMCKHFKCSWSYLLERAGLKPKYKRVRRKTEEELLRDLRKLHKKLERPLIKSDIDDSPDLASSSTYSRKFRSFPQACARAKVPCKLNQDEELMLAIIADYIREFGRAPTAAEFGRCDYYHNNRTTSTYAKKFGSWNAAVAAAQK